MSGKRKPSPESPLVSLSPNSLLLASPPLFVDDDESINNTSFIKANQQKNKELTKSAKLQKPQKQKALLSTRAKTIDSALDNSDYDNVQSPGGVSNASSDGPVYIRTPGFEHHAQEFETQKNRQRIEGEREEPGASRSSSKTPLASKKKKSLLQGASDVDVIRKTDPSSCKQKPKKEPLPMKLRALPQSFWQQPNQTNCLSPGAIYPILPPLSSLGAAKDDVENVAAGMRSSASPEECRREVSVANTDLLFSLFRGIEEEQTKVTVVRRGRPKKPPSTVLTRVLRDEDPCLVSTVTESILPLIPDRTGSGTHGTRLTQGQQVLAMVSLKDGDKSVSLPSLNVEHNYSQILSELVIKL